MPSPVLNPLINGHLWYLQESLVEIHTALTYPQMRHFLLAKLCVTAHVHAYIDVRLCVCACV